MQTIHLNTRQHIVLTSWLSEAPWIAPDECLDDMLRIDKACAQTAPDTPFVVAYADATLIVTYLDYIYERPSADGDATTLAELIELFEPSA